MCFVCSFGCEHCERNAKRGPEPVSAAEATCAQPIATNLSQIATWYEIHRLQSLLLTKQQHMAEA